MTKAQKRFKRLLLAIPLIASREQGVPVDELIKKVGYLKREDLAQDMEFLEEVILPGVGFDTYLAPVQQRQRVKFKYPAGRQMGSFPLSITPREQLVLSLSLERLVREGVFDKRSRTVRLITRLLRQARSKGNSGQQVLAVDAGHKLDKERLAILRDGLRKKQSVEIIYYTASRGGLARRRVDSYDIYFNGDEWYLIGHCRLSKGIRTFRVDRIKEVKSTTVKYEVADDYRLSEYVSAAGFKVSSDAVRVKLRFPERIARQVREEFTGETIRKSKQGGVEVEVPSAVPSWVVNRALCYADSCELLEPIELRDELVAKAKRVLAIYEGSKRRAAGVAKAGKR
jgi:proteasome accessory factor C